MAVDSDGRENEKGGSMSRGRPRCSGKMLKRRLRMRGHGSGENVENDY